jgi:N-acetylglucosaminyl-diphospho-decaprenol L-rhamnosyltransferase
VLAQPTAVHAGGASSDAARRRQWLVRSRLEYADKWGGRRRLQAALGAATAANLAWNAGRRIAGRDVAPLRTAREEAALLRRRTRSRSAP